jgi:hypothetical protein
MSLLELFCTYFKYYFATINKYKKPNFSIKIKKTGLLSLLWNVEGHMLLQLTCTSKGSSFFIQITHPQRVLKSHKNQFPFSIRKY